VSSVLHRAERAVIPKMTPAEFQAFQATRPDHERWELVGGVATMMARATIAHNHIAGRLERLLNERMERYAPSLVATQRPGVELDSGDHRPEPDVAVIDADYAAGQRFAEKAFLLAEVASKDDNMIVPGADRRWIDVKRDVYRAHESCEAVLIVAEDVMRVELDLKTEGGCKSSVLAGSDAELVVSCIGFRCFLSEIYQGTPLRPREKARD
jgi:Uma2 family endonuclease